MFEKLMRSKVLWLLLFVVMAIILQQLLAPREDQTEKQRDEVLSIQEIDGLIASAERGSSKAQKELGNVYYYGKGTQIDLEKAVHWWEKAACQENAVAQYNLGVFYLEDTKDQDIHKAILWLMEAVKNGDREAPEQLGIARQKRAQKDEEQQKPIDTLIAEAESGSSEAQKALGNAYYYGKGTQTDNTKAVYWWEKAANQENAAAQYRLGVFYLRCGTVQSMAQALLWLQKAAQNGHKEAQQRLQNVREKEEAEESLKIAEALRAAKGPWFTHPESSAVNDPELKLISAVAWGRIDEVRDLLKQGVNPNAIAHKNPFKGSALGVAADKSYNKIALLFLDYGADPNIPDTLGGTPLMDAAEKGNLELVQLLLNRKATVGATDINGDNVLDYAKRSRNPQVIRKFKSLE